MTEPLPPRAVIVVDDAGIRALELTGLMLHEGVLTRFTARLPTTTVQILSEQLAKLGIPADVLQERDIFIDLVTIYNKTEVFIPSDPDKRFVDYKSFMLSIADVLYRTYAKVRSPYMKYGIPAYYFPTDPTPHNQKITSLFIGSLGTEASDPSIPAQPESTTLSSPSDSTANAPSSPDPQTQPLTPFEFQFPTDMITTILRKISTATHGAMVNMVHKNKPIKYPDYYRFISEIPLAVLIAAVKDHAAVITDDDRRMYLHIITRAITLGAAVAIIERGIKQRNKNYPSVSRIIETFVIMKLEVFDLLAVEIFSCMENYYNNPFDFYALLLAAGRTDFISRLLDLGIKLTVTDIDCVYQLLDHDGMHARSLPANYCEIVDQMLGPDILREFAEYETNEFGRVRIDILSFYSLYYSLKCGGFTNSFHPNLLIDIIQHHPTLIKLPFGCGHSFSHEYFDLTPDQKNILRPFCDGGRFWNYVLNGIVEQCPLYGPVSDDMFKAILSSSDVYHDGMNLAEVIEELRSGQPGTTLPLNDIFSIKLRTNQFAPEIFGNIALAVNDIQLDFGSDSFMELWFTAYEIILGAELDVNLDIVTAALARMLDSDVKSKQYPHYLKLAERLVNYAATKWSLETALRLHVPFSSNICVKLFQQDQQPTQK